MSQIRNMLRALAYDHGGLPGLIVSRLDHALSMFDNSPAATLVCGRIEEGREERTFHWTDVGHLPPLLIGADGASTAARNWTTAVATDGPLTDRGVELQLLLTPRPVSGSVTDTRSRPPACRRCRPRPGNANSPGASRRGL
ncbi:SpoIIE family protein phosphatase [Streptomyces sp. NPDC058545]|uniref:SpoIIE family protein phosphatase n=1 Tax=Streptomyces sp. NPDC058545 TaxID=3346544 RepID=UPI003648A839